MSTVYLELMQRIRRIIIELESYSDFEGCAHRISSLIGILSTLNAEYEGEFDQCLQLLINASDLIHHISTFSENPILRPSLSRHNPGACVGHLGHPKLSIPVQQLQFLLFTCKFSAQSAAEILNVSRRTIFRRLAENGLKISETFSEMSDDELDLMVSQILQNYPDIGYRSVKAHLLAAGHNVQEQRVRQAMRNVDMEGCIIRRLQLRPVRRRNYKVKAPNSLWHIDGYHKLISWRFVIHGGVDGFSRLPVFLKVSTNNTAITVLSTFLQAVEDYGLPQRVRSDKGGENVEVARYMIENRGPGRGSHITGRSVHNQRIERFWRDLWEGCVGFYYNLFCYMEMEDILSPCNEHHLAALHFIFLPRIQKSLDEFRRAYMNRPLRTERGRTPLQIWVRGQIQDNDELLTEDDMALYGSSYEGGVTSLDLMQVEVPQHTWLNEEKLVELNTLFPPLQPSENFGVDVFTEVRDYILANY